MTTASVPPITVPLVGVPCCRNLRGDHYFHMVGEKYVDAAAQHAGVLPLAIPALGASLPLDALIARLDGLLLTGSPSNVEPVHYGAEPAIENDLSDPARDSTTLPLIRLAMAAGMPILGICRGMQELNVALGGTLHQEVHKLEGRIDHRADKTAEVDAQYGPAHVVTLTPDGPLAALAGTGEITINSLHGQGIDRLAAGLTVEAVAPDGQIEAVRHCAAGFCIGVQWHPEWRAIANPFSVRLFEAFGAACRAYAAGRRTTQARLQA